ncbi:MAG: hypothetical protein IT443_03905 [Phycisphaeraceae bacterium]|nr:hypothetical protein [Phycisphaeraceae bacterium]
MGYDFNISASDPDWHREHSQSWWDPARRLLGTLRGFQAGKQRGGFVGAMVRKWNVVCHRFWSMVTGAEVPLTCRIGGGLLMPHPNGVVIHPRAEIGPNCLIFQQVTIGTGGKIPGVPKIGGHVDIGAGAKVLGGVKIGDHAKIGANAVVLDDVPEGATAVGVPARMLLARHETRKIGPSANDKQAG